MKVPTQKCLIYFLNSPNYNLQIKHNYLNYIMIKYHNCFYILKELWFETIIIVIAIIKQLKFNAQLYVCIVSSRYKYIDKKN